MQQSIAVILALVIISLTRATDAAERSRNDATTTRTNEANNSDSDIHADTLTHLKRSSILFGLTDIANEQLVNATCYQQLKQIQHAFLHKQLWALKVVDGSGNKKPGFMFGNNFWLGSREICNAIKSTAKPKVPKHVPHSVKLAILTEHAPFDLDYRVIYLQQHSTKQVDFQFAFSNSYIHVGLCLPSSCSLPEVELLMAKYVGSDLFLYGDVYDFRPQVVYAKDVNLSAEFYASTALVLIVTVFVFTIVMMCSAFILRVLEAGALRKFTEQMADVKENADKSKSKTAKSVGSDSQYDFLKGFIRCFDVQANWNKLFTLSVGEANEFALINGLRSIGALAVVMFHIFYFPEASISNKVHHYIYAERAASMVILVDAFFAISGFLRTFIFLRNHKQCELLRQNSFTQNCQEFLRLLLHRFLRLAPLYFVTLIAVDLLYMYLEDVSVFHINEHLHSGCTNYWWRNVLFIQNFFDYRDMCALWSWSLAVEMQYFILSTLLLLLYVKYAKLVKLLVPLLLLANIAWTLLKVSNSDCHANLEVVSTYFTEIYSNPTLRILPYILGAIAGWCAVELQPKFKLNALIRNCLWLASILIYFISAFGSFFSSFTPVWCAESVVVTGRMLFALSCCWMILASRNGRGGWWSHFFEINLFQHINKLSYGLYLLHPIVIMCFFCMSNSSAYLQRFTFWIWFMGILSMVYIAALIGSLAFEMPYYNWSSMMLKRGKQKSA